MVCFDVKSLFTNVPLDRTNQLVLKGIYEKHEVSTNITKQEMKEMLILCTKNVHFTFNPLSANLTKWPNTLKQFVGKLPTNCLSVFDHFVGLALKGLMNPLGPALADVFMVELENNIVPVLQENLSFWKQYS